jgi:hypothetical protein
MCGRKMFTMWVLISYQRKSTMFTTWENCLPRGGNDGYGKGVLNGCMEA